MVQIVSCLQSLSQLQTEVALSTTEAEYITLNLVMQELIPLKAFLKESTPVLQLTTNQPLIHWKACANDSRCLFEGTPYELAKAPKLYHHTKHNALKYDHFRQHIVNGTIQAASNWDKRSTSRYTGFIEKGKSLQHQELNILSRVFQSFQTVAHC
jgi:hypothetical protein